MSSLVFHYDQNQRNACEAIGIVNSSERLRSFVGDFRHEAPLDPPTLTRDKMIVLVSPSNYQQRKKKHFTVWKCASSRCSFRGATLCRHSNLRLS